MIHRTEWEYPRIFSFSAVNHLTTRLRVYRMHLLIRNPYTAIWLQTNNPFKIIIDFVAEKVFPSFSTYQIELNQRDFLRFTWNIMESKNILITVETLTRESLDRNQNIFALHNVSSKAQEVSLVELNLIGTETWKDLLSDEVYDDLEGVIRLEPYSCVWISNQ